MGLEIKNLKHEANALRAQTHANEQTIKSLQFQLEDLNHKLKVSKLHRSFKLQSGIKYLLLSV